MRKTKMLKIMCKYNNEDSGREMGIFVAGGILNESDQLYDYEINIRKSLMIWFNNNLEVPDIQASESNRYSNPNAISWFKSSAVKHISKMREYIEILKAHNVPVKQLIM